jgi:hypothetical protein
MKLIDTANSDFSEERLSKIEKFNRVILPDDYKKFIRDNNGGRPEENILVALGNEFVVQRFLSIIENPTESQYGDYDIEVVLTQLDERLSDNPDLLGNELIPIASLFGGDFVCLDFKHKGEPKVVIWFHEESDEFSPVVRNVAETFNLFINMLKK